MKNWNDVIKNRTTNAYKDWSIGKGRDIESNIGEKTAQGRFKKEYFFVYNKPKFKISKNTSVYTIGSCFARNVEQALLLNGLNVPSTEIKIDETKYVSKPRFHNTVLNKYNPHSMANEIMRGLSKMEFKNNGLIKLSDDKYYDPQTSHLGAMSQVDAINMRQEINRVGAKIKTSECLLLTLGLTETWFDIESNIAFNAINPVLVRPIRDKLTFKNVTVNEAFDVLLESFKALKKVVPNVKIIVTVSPVPILNTFTDMDIVSANSISKSTLRVVAEMLKNSLDYVDYYPSYEMVINSNRDFAWSEDKAHVTDNVVSEVIKTFIERYID